MSWTKTRLKHLCTDSGQYGLNISSDHYSNEGTRLIRTTDISGNSGQLKEGGVYVDSPLEERHKLQPGDLLLSRSGSLGQSYLTRDGDCGSTYAGYLVRFRPQPQVDPKFLSYAAHSAAFQSAITADAVSSTIQNFNAEKYANISLLAPSLEEQRRIVDYLDAETARIDTLLRYCRLRQRILEERTRANAKRILSEASSAKHTRLKFLLATRPRYGVLVPQFVDGGTKFIRVNDLVDLEGRSENLLQIPRSLSAQYPTTIVKDGDILVSVVGTLGRVAIAGPSVVGANVNRAIAILRPKTGVDGALLAAWIDSADFEKQALLATGNDSAQRTLGMEDIANFALTWPSNAGEQQEIARAISSERHKSRQLIERLSRQERLLAERRQALITAAVTGQIDASTASGRGIED
ncbi:restriction endonuclease subunit S [Polymorphospora rubra]|uniref:restriction endonuclease subunit S n=1 Tax=Polymorphospora rubra TaxID=338584 RepID=UPI00340D4FC9